LYVSYGIIKAHKGHIEVSSTKGIGTKFDIFLPAAKDRRKETRDLSEKIILLADDEETLRDLLAELLEASNYSVIKVSGGDEVLKVLTEEIKADLLIIDHHMPGMSGLDCIREIKKLNYDFPIILSTGSLSSTANVNLKEENISAVIYKPYDFDELLKKINEIL
jgi:DNA-binding response OmpR family regulator